MRKFQFQSGEYYHIYNRGVEARDIFADNYDYLRFLRSMREFNRLEAIGSIYELDNLRKKERTLGVHMDTECPPAVDFISYCLNPNHYHFLLGQTAEGGIEKFMHKLSMGYAKYFNEKYSRSGSLFQGAYKAIHADNYGYLLKLLVYVNCNHEIHNLGKTENWPWASYLDSVGMRSGNLCNLDIVREEFGESENFKSFCQEIIPDIKENKVLKKYLLE
ncbi:MAG: transposase [bacterium]|nr:transposase [bacterium]